MEQALTTLGVVYGIGFCFSFIFGMWRIMEFGRFDMMLMTPVWPVLYLKFIIRYWGK